MTGRLAKKQNKNKTRKFKPTFSLIKYPNK